MIRILSKFILNKIIGWKVIGYLPTKEKYVIAVVPHSSYFDLIIAVLIRTYSGLKIKFIGKFLAIAILTIWLIDIKRL